MGLHSLLLPHFFQFTKIFVELAFIFLSGLSFLPPLVIVPLVFRGILCSFLAPVLTELQTKLHVGCIFLSLSTSVFMLLSVLCALSNEIERSELTT